MAAVDQIRMPSYPSTYLIISKRLMSAFSKRYISVRVYLELTQLREQYQCTTLRPLRFITHLSLFSSNKRCISDVVSVRRKTFPRPSEVRSFKGLANRVNIVLNEIVESVSRNPQAFLKI